MIEIGFVMFEVYYLCDQKGSALKQRCLILHIESIRRGLTVLCLLYPCRKPSIMGLGER